MNSRAVDLRFKANRSKLYSLKDPMHGKKGKAFQDAFDKAFSLDAIKISRVAMERWERYYERI